MAIDHHRPPEGAKASQKSLAASQSELASPLRPKASAESPFWSLVEARKRPAIVGFLLRAFTGVKCIPCRCSSISAHLEPSNQQDALLFRDPGYCSENGRQTLDGASSACHFSVMRCRCERAAAPCKPSMRLEAFEAYKSASISPKSNVHNVLPPQRAFNSRCASPYACTWPAVASSRPAIAGRICCVTDDPLAPPGCTAETRYRVVTAHCGPVETAVACYQTT